MNEVGRTFLLDANVLIAAHRGYYAFDLCPGFWKSISEGHASGRIFSTSRVESELMKGKTGDTLTTWLATEMPDDFFLDDATAEIAAEFAPLMAWVASGQFLSAAQAKFASDADGWLIATARKLGYCLVTHEARQDAAKARVPMPNVCDEFGVAYCNTYEMLRELGCSYS